VWKGMLVCTRRIIFDIRIPRSMTGIRYSAIVREDELAEERPKAFKLISWGIVNKSEVLHICVLNVLCLMCCQASLQLVVGLVLGEW
jgi:hypothetical protein